MQTPNGAGGDAAFDVSGGPTARKYAVGTATADLYRAAFEVASVGQLQVSLETGRFALVNEAYCQMVGRTKQELLKLRPTDITHPDDVEATRHVIEQCIKGEIDTISMEKRYIRPDGTVVWGFINTRVLRDESGKPILSVGVVENITERVKAQRNLQLRESHMRLAMEAAGVVDFEWDIATDRVRRLNSREPALPPTDSDTLEAVVRAVHPEDRERIRTEVENALRSTDGEYSCEYRVVRPDGVIRWLSDKGRVIFCKGKPVRVIGVGHDVTEKRLLEDQIRESARHFRTLIETCPQLVWYCDASGACTFQAPQWEAVTGQPTEEALRSGWLECLHPDDRAGIISSWERAVRAGKREYRGEYRLRTKAGYRWFVAMARAVEREDGSIRAWVGTSTDIDDARRMSAEYRSLFESVAAGHAEVHFPTGRFVRANRRYCEMLGYTEQELISGKTLVDVTHADHRKEVLIATDRLRADPAHSVAIQERYLRKDGSSVWVEVTRKVISEGEEPMTRLLITAIDITDRKLAEGENRRISSRLAAQKAAMELTLGGSPLPEVLEQITRAACAQTTDGARAALFVLDEDCACLRVKAATGMTERYLQEVDGFKISPSQPSCGAAAYTGQTVIVTNTEEDERWQSYRDFALAHQIVSCWSFPILASGGKVLGTLAVLPDKKRHPDARAVEAISLLTQSAALVIERFQSIDELRLHREHLQELVDRRTEELEASYERLRSAERMAAIGTLAAGLGHDMGNLLMPVRVSLETLAMMNLPQAARDELRGIESSAGYLRELASGLRLLATDTKRSSSTGVTDLREWWTDAETVLRNTLAPGIQLSEEMPKTVVRARIDRAALMQAVFNLVQNSVDSLREMPGGSVIVWSRESGDEVLVGVTDTGPGMSDDVKRRCMEPFFTTKPRSMSTGLGLALVFGLVREAGGTVELESSPGRGTTFTLRLKRAASEAADTRPPRRVAIEVKDARMRAFVSAELEHLRCEVSGDRAYADILVSDNGAEGFGGPVVSIARLNKPSQVKAALMELFRTGAQPQDSRG